MNYPLEERPTPSQTPQMAKLIARYIEVRQHRLESEASALEARITEEQLAKEIASILRNELGDVLHLATSEKWTGE